MIARTERSDGRAKRLRRERQTASITNADINQRSAGVELNIRCTEKVRNEQLEYLPENRNHRTIHRPTQRTRRRGPSAALFFSVDGWVSDGEGHWGSKAGWGDWGSPLRHTSSNGAVEMRTHSRLESYKKEDEFCNTGSRMREKSNCQRRPFFFRDESFTWYFTLKR